MRTDKEHIERIELLTKFTEYGEKGLPSKLVYVSEICYLLNYIKELEEEINSRNKNYNSSYNTQTTVEYNQDIK